uniref:Tripartite motif containing 29 n=1 Tax=Microcebus murinus TaxID=30608 RepID=A0A8C5VUJ9_MICMU
MEAADASRSNGSSPEARDARGPSGPNGSLENGTKADGKDAKTTNGHSGETAEGKNLGPTLKPGEGKRGAAAAQVHLLGAPEAHGVHRGAGRGPAEQLPPGRRGPLLPAQAGLRGGAVRLLHRQQAEGRQVLPGVPGLLLRAAPQAPPGGRRLPRPPAARAHPGL